MASAKINRIETLSDNKYPLERVEFEIEGRQQQKEVYRRPNSAAALLIDQERKVALLTKQFRLPVFLNNDGPSLTEVCAGLMENDELPETCIIREIEEETGYRVNQIEEVASVYLSPASLTEKAWLFIGHYSEEMKVNEGGGIKDEGEDIRLLEVTFNQLRNFLKERSLHDAKTILLIQHALLNNLI